MASHDLQEPLRKIITYSERLAASAAARPADADYLERMQKAAGRMKTLIEELLEYSRVSRDEHRTEDVDLSAVLADVLNDLDTRIAETGAQVVVGDLPHVRGSAAQLRQLFQNLLSNAIKFRRDGETPRVTVTGRVVGQAPRRGLMLEVSDQGIGFDEKYVDRIFKPFQRLHGKGRYEGSGIGLAICRKIAERHGGAITAKSRPGEGSVFTVTLPLEEAPKGGWKEWLASADSSDHLVHFYTDEHSLARMVAHYVGEGLEKDEPAVLIAVPEHLARIEKELAVRHDVAALRKDGRLFTYDARSTLASLSKDGRPDGDAFRAVIGAALDRAEIRALKRRVRAYGEMVNLLWADGRQAEALELERFWNDLAGQRNFSLFCAYRADALETPVDAAWTDVCRSHSHVIPVEHPERLDAAVSRALDEALGSPQAEALRGILAASRTNGHAVMPEAQRTLLWLREKLPAFADTVYEKARRYYAGEAAPAVR